MVGSTLISLSCANYRKSININGPSPQQVIPNKGSVDISRQVDRNLEISIKRAPLISSSMVLKYSPGNSQNAVTTANNLNVRSGPGVNYPKIGFLQKNWVVQLNHVTGEWANIGHKQWVFIDYLNIKQPKQYK